MLQPLPVEGYLSVRLNFSKSLKKELLQPYCNWTVDTQDSICHHLVLIVDSGSCLQQSLNCISMSILSSYPQRNTVWFLVRKVSNLATSFNILMNAALRHGLIPVSEWTVFVVFVVCRIVSDFAMLKVPSNLDSNLNTLD